MAISATMFQFQHHIFHNNANWNIFYRLYSFLMQLNLPFGPSVEYIYYKFNVWLNLFNIGLAVYKVQNYLFPNQHMCTLAYNHRHNLPYTSLPFQRSTACKTSRVYMCIYMISLLANFGPSHEIVFLFLLLMNKTIWGWPRHFQVFNP